VQHGTDGGKVEGQGAVRNLPCVEVDSLSGLRLSKRTICDAELRERLEMSSCRMLTLPSLQSNALISSTPWATIGILSRVEHRETKSGQPCAM
jgi:hypothetical protein